jgi:hypothetical protein
VEGWFEELVLDPLLLIFSQFLNNSLKAMYHSACKPLVLVSTLFLMLEYSSFVKQGTIIKLV